MLPQWLIMKHSFKSESLCQQTTHFFFLLTMLRHKLITLTVARTILQNKLIMSITSIEFNIVVRVLLTKKTREAEKETSFTALAAIKNKEAPSIPSPLMKGGAKLNRQRWVPCNIILDLSYFVNIKYKINCIIQCFCLNSHTTNIRSFKLFF